MLPAFSQSTPVSLLDRVCRQPTPEDWSAFIALYSPVLFKWCQRLKLNDTDAEDMVQEVLAALPAKLSTFTYEPALRFRGWLWTVLLNTVREHRRRRQLPLADGVDLDKLSVPDELQQLVEEDYRRHLIERAVRLIAAEFPESAVRAFQLFVREKRPAREVAEQVGISTDAVYQAKSRILRRLKQELAGLLE
jgi:RNA polymerase sigma-70 factor (ECF subfamily)